MTLVDALIHAAAGAAATVLPISASGHHALTRIWLGDDPALPTLMGAVGLGSAFALAAFVRSRWVPVLRTFRRHALAPRELWAREPGREALALVVAAGLSTLVSLLIHAPMERASRSPVAVGLGLLLTAVALGTTPLAPAAKRVAPTALASTWIGLAHGLGTAPGISQAGAAFVVASWLGVRGWRAAEFALMVTTATALVDGARGLTELSGLGSTLALHATLAFGTALVVAALAAAAWRWLAERRRTTWLLAWLIPLAVATLGYARAAPAPRLSASHGQPTAAPWAWPCLTDAMKGHGRRLHLRAHHGWRRGHPLLARVA